MTKTQAGRDRVSFIDLFKKKVVAMFGRACVALFKLNLWFYSALTLSPW
jgi:hypothetical protein